MSRCALWLLGTLLCGCSNAVVEPRAPADASVEPKPSLVAEVGENDEAEPVLSGETGPLLRRTDPRRLGDVLVYRFERQGRAPIVLTETVDAQNADTTEVLVSFAEGDTKESLRIVLSRLTERVLRVTKDNADRTALPLSTYEKMMAKTAFSPEENLGLVLSKEETCLVGSAEASCETKKFRVLVGAGEAELTIQRNSAWGRDVLGEVVRDDGVVLYRANLVEAVRGAEIPAEKSAQALRERTVRETLLGGETL